MIEEKENSNVESALEIVNGKLYEREYYDNHYSTSSDYDYKEVDLTPIKAELSKIPALEKEKVDAKIEEMRLEGLLELSNSIGKANANKLNAIEEVHKNDFNSAITKCRLTNQILNRSDSNDK